MAAKPEQMISARNDGDRGARSILQYKCTDEKRIADPNIWTRGVNLDAHRGGNFFFGSPQRRDCAADRFWSLLVSADKTER